MGDILNNFFDMIKTSEISNYFSTMFAYPIKAVFSIIDIIIVVFLFYKGYKILKNTRAMQLIKGIIVLIVLNILSSKYVFDLYFLHSILDYFMQYGIILIAVIFQPELRKALEQVGNTNIRKWFDLEDEETITCIPEVAKAAKAMSATKTGMLVVFEKDTSLGEIAHTGVSIDSDVSAELLINIFVKDTPLHDGAVIIKNNRIEAASCILPLTDKESLDRIFGTRHRAAIGVSEVTDAVVAVVSEETGAISLAVDGRIYRDLSADQLEKELTKRLAVPKVKKNNIVKKIKGKR
ncbi:MAG: diadenylate cyclase CdaA [Clostridia bacterium]|nr:diadenylate cyclase CdaA [Clostridia bacterium]